MPAVPPLRPPPPSSAPYNTPPACPVLCIISQRYEHTKKAGAGRVLDNRGGSKQIREQVEPELRVDPVDDRPAARLRVALHPAVGFLRRRERQEQDRAAGRAGAGLQAGEDRRPREGADRGHLQGGRRGDQALPGVLGPRDPGPHRGPQGRGGGDGRLAAPRDRGGRGPHAGGGGAAREVLLARAGAAQLPGEPDKVAELPRGGGGEARAEGAGGAGGGALGRALRGEEEAAPRETGEEAGRRTAGAALEARGRLQREDQGAGQKIRDPPQEEPQEKSGVHQTVPRAHPQPQRHPHGEQVQLKHLFPLISSVIFAHYQRMIRLELPASDPSLPVPVPAASGSSQEAGGFRVNWLTQRGQRETAPQSQERRLIDTSNIRHLKLCLRKEINLVPARHSGQTSELVLVPAPPGPAETRRMGCSQEPGKHSSGNSHKNSCEKRAKLSLISKRPSLRKISDFISFKQETETGMAALEDRNENRAEKEKETMGAACKEPQTLKRQGKKCIRISSKRPCLAEIIKN